MRNIINMLLVILFLIYFSNHSFSQDNSNYKVIDSILANPDLIASKMYEKNQFKNSQQYLKYFIYKKNIKSYQVIEDKMLFDGLSQKFHVNTISIMDTNSNNKLIFIFNYQNNLIDIVDHINSDEDAVKKRYEILECVLKYPDSLNYYENIYSYDGFVEGIIKHLIKDSITDFEILYDNWYVTNPIHNIQIRVNPSRKKWLLGFEKDDDKWKIIEFSERKPGGYPDGDCYEEDDDE